jgi:hypothetical protein
MLKKFLSFVVIAIAFATSCSEVSAQVTPTIDSVRIDSIILTGSNARVHFKYFNAQGASLFSYRCNYGVSPNVNANSSQIQSSPAGTDTASIVVSVLSNSTSYDFKIVFYSPTYAESDVKSGITSGGGGGSCTMGLGATSAFLCIGQSTTLSAALSGGVGNISYIWSPGNLTGASVTVTPTTTTTYTVTGTDGVGCSATKSITVVVGSGGGSITVLQDTSICAGQPVTLSVSSTQTVTSYQWSNGATTPTIMVSPNITTTYVATIAYTSGCTMSKDVVVTVKNSPAIIQTSKDTVCLNSISGISVVGYPVGGVFVGEVSNGMFDHASAGVGNHLLKYTSNEAGCVSEDSVYVWVMNVPQISSWSYDQAGNLILNGSFPYSIEIAVNSVTYTPVVQNASQAIFSNLSLVNGDLIIVKSLGGGDCFSTFYITATNSDTALESEVIKIYPNPCRDNTLEINSYQQEGEMFRVFNRHGKEVLSVLIEGKTSVNISELPTGIYYARLGSNSNVIKILRE